MTHTKKIKNKINQLKAPLFQLFWENSKINDVTGIKLAQNIEADAAEIPLSPQLLYASLDYPLIQPKDRLAKTMQQRQSLRKFSKKSLSEKQLGSLFFAFSQLKDKRRLLASAGGKYPIEVFAITWNMASPALNKKILYYNVGKHALSILKDAPDWPDLKTFITPEAMDAPNILFFFVAFPERTCKKYAERGGRFVLIEAGHYAQNLSLRVAQEKLAGYELGSVHDDKILSLLGLEKTEAMLCLAYACGTQ